MDYAAHIKDGKIQTIQEHCENVAHLAISLGGAFGFDASKMLEVIGKLHDIGKYADKWQKYIRGELKSGKIDHSSAGAKEIKKLYEKTENNLITAILQSLTSLNPRRLAYIQEKSHNRASIDTHPL